MWTWHSEYLGICSRVLVGARRDRHSSFAPSCTNIVRLWRKQLQMKRLKLSQDGSGLLAAREMISTGAKGWC